jgi:hypothetical protein
VAVERSSEVTYLIKFENLLPAVTQIFCPRPHRTPFQWDDTENAGFCEFCKPWLPVHDNYRTLNLAKQREDKKSFFKFYQHLSQLRSTPTYQNGDFTSRAYNDKVFAFKRTYNDETNVIVINLGNSAYRIDVNEMNGGFSKEMEIIVAGPQSFYETGDVAFSNAFIVLPYDAVVLKSKESTADPSTTTPIPGTPSTTEDTPTTTAASATLIASFTLCTLIILHFLF